MGLSSNQARFLSLTARQVDLEHRIQQVCQRRLRLSSELENVATAYNNSISNRKMFTPSASGINNLSVSNLAALGYKVIDANKKLVQDRPSVNPVGQTVINSQADFMNIVSLMNTGDLTALSGNYQLNCDMDLSSLGPLNNSLIQNIFTGTFDGNGHTISNLNINTSAALINIGLFSRIGGTVKNIALENASVNAANTNSVGGLAGSVSGGIITNCSSSGTITGSNNVGGLIGYNTLSTVSNSSSSANVTAYSSNSGGFAGMNKAATITNCSASGNVSSNSTGNVGGFVGTNIMASTISSSFATGSVTANVAASVGGFVGNTSASISDSYSTGYITAVSGSSTGGFAGSGVGGISKSYTTSYVDSSGGNVGGFTGTGGQDNSNFYQNNMSTDAAGSLAVNGNISPLPTGTWGAASWDTSTTPPTLLQAGTTQYVDDIEEGLRNGTYSLAKVADEFSQDTFGIGNGKYEEVDWRSTPEIYDELYKGDDVDAENKYDKTVDEINSQDKKLQLEQTTIEVEYKAVASEKEAVKKILDTNATSSFKYFS